MEKQLLKDSQMVLSSELLKKEFGVWYSVYEEFISIIQSEEFSFSAEWRYYKDGKAWLCKITHKKKTVVWLSAWTNFFKLGFYFTEKTGAGISDLSISDILKQNYEANKPIGRLKPLVADVNKQSQLSDIYSLLRYKIRA